jgi:hypothetical protein
VKRHIFHSEAEKEYTEAANFYFQINPELAGRFYDEVEGLIRDVRTQPERFEYLMLLSAGTSRMYFLMRSFLSISPTAL